MAMLLTQQTEVAPTIGVVATTINGTKAALLAAQREARAYGARIVLLVPRVDAPAPPAERFVDTSNWLVARFEKVARDVGQPVQVRVVTASTAAKGAELLSPANGILFVGGPIRWLWPSSEQRMAARLRRSGRQVVFVGCEKG